MKGKEMQKILNIPNTITAIRLLLVIPLGYYLIEYNRAVAVTLFLAIMAMDLLDGHLARRLKQVTFFGQSFDYISDIITGGTIFIISAVSGRINIWIVILCAIAFLAYGILAIKSIGKNGHLVTRIKRPAATWTFLFVFLMLLDLEGRWVDIIYYVFTAGIYGYTLYYYLEIKKKTQMKKRRKRRKNTKKSN